MYFHGTCSRIALILVYANVLQNSLISNIAKSQVINSSRTIATEAGTIVTVGRTNDNTDNKNNIVISNESDIEDEIRNRNSNGKILSRKRRYLLFPEGSSFQIVWDGIIGVVDYTNYLILGITLALAWELPHKPPSEILEDIQQQLKDGTFGINRNDNATNITYIDTTTDKPNKLPHKYINFEKKLNSTNSQYNYYKTIPFQPLFRPPMHQKYFISSRPNNYRIIHPSNQNGKTNYYTSYNSYIPQKTDWRRKDNNYYQKFSHRQQPFTSWINNKSKFYDHKTSLPNSDKQYPWFNLASRLSNSLRGNFKSSSLSPRTQQPFKHKPNKGNDKRKTKFQHIDSQQMQRSHRIYPIFGKRSIPDFSNTPLSSANDSKPNRHRRSGIETRRLTKIDEIHIRYQRSTRHHFYDKIERYLDQRGSNGHHCVLRTLCETGQKALTDQDPGSFVAELMRAVFTMPEPIDNDSRAGGSPYLAQRYDAANAFNGNCAVRYHLCKDSLWNSQYL